MAIAKTTFVSGADESLAAPDAYGGPPQEAVSPITSIGAARLLTIDKKPVDPVEVLEDLIKGILPKSKEFLDTAESVKKGIAVLSQVLDKPERFFNDVKGNLIKDLVTSVGYGKQADDISKMIMGESGALSPLDFLAKNNPKMKIILGGVEKIRSAKDITDVNSLLKVVGDLSGDTALGEVLNIGPQMSVVKSLVGKAMELKLPELSESILSLVDGDYEKALVTLHSVPLAAKYGHIDFIEKAIEDFTPERILGMAPDIVNTVLTNYKFPPDGYKTVSQLAVDLIAQCNKLDPSWCTDIRNGVPVYSVKNMNDISPDAKKALLEIPEHIMGALIAGEYEEASLLIINELNYPYMPKVQPA